MLFTVGIETPKQDNEAFGLVVPALFTEEYSCFSAADTVEQIPSQAVNAIHSVLEMMLEDGADISLLKDLGFANYKGQEDFSHCDAWLLIDVDTTAYLGKKQRVNVVLPQYILDRIDQRVLTQPAYKDRSHFLAIASQHELATPSI